MPRNIIELTVHLYSIFKNPHGQSPKEYARVAKCFQCLLVETMFTCGNSSVVLMFKIIHLFSDVPTINIPLSHIQWHLIFLLL